MANKSYYNYIYKNNSGNWVIYNTLNSALAVLSEEEKDIYDTIPMRNINVKTLFEKELYSLGFIVDGDYDEKGIVTNSRYRRAFIEKSGYIRILTTTFCNANCDYCYEKGFRQTYMTMETAKQVVKFILERPRMEILYLHWFGGEPLLNINVIDFIMDNVYEELQNRGTKLYVYITSNASLINEEMVNRMRVRWHVDWIQVTVDELEDKYNDIKNYNSPNYNFTTVVKNIEILLKQGILVKLRINFDKSELEKVAKISEYFSKKFHKYYTCGLLHLTPSPIFDISSENREEIMPSPYKSLGLYEAYIKMQSKCDNNRDLFDLSFKGGQCYACHQGSFVIDPEGNLFKCTVTIRDVSTNVGTVYKGVKANKEYFKWISPNLPKQCDDCIFLPICQGGCKAGQLGYINHCCNYFVTDIQKILNYKIEMSITKNTT